MGSEGDRTSRSRIHVICVPIIPRHNRGGGSIMILACSRGDLRLRLVGFLADDVSRWVVAADDVSGVVAARHWSAADVGGGRPDHLRVVAALVAAGAGVGVVIVVLLLAHPIADGIPRRPGGSGGSPEQILAIRASWVHQIAARATARLRLRVVKSVGLHGGVPNDGRDADRVPGAVVGVQVRALRRRLRIGMMFGVQDQYREERNRRNCAPAEEFSHSECGHTGTLGWWILKVWRSLLLMIGDRPIQDGRCRWFQRCRRCGTYGWWIDDPAFIP